MVLRWLTVAAALHCWCNGAAHVVRARVSGARFSPTSTAVTLCTRHPLRSIPTRRHKQRHAPLQLLEGTRWSLQLDIGAEPGEW